MRLVPAMLALFAPLAGHAEEMPPAGYFTGTYEMIGRMPGASSPAFGDSLTITAENGRLILTSDAHGTGWLARNDAGHEGASPLVGPFGGRQMLCRFQSDGNNYPRLTCLLEPVPPEEAPGRLTFWPVP